MTNHMKLCTPHERGNKKQLYATRFLYESVHAIPDSKTVMIYGLMPIPHISRAINININIIILNDRKLFDFANISRHYKTDFNLL